VIAAVPASEMSDAGTVAVSSVALTNVVASAPPLQRTLAVATKLPPDTLNVNPELPATADLELSPVMNGRG